MFTRAHQVRKYAYRVRQNVFNQQGCLWDIFICPIQAGAEPDIFIWGATGGVSFGTRGAVNGLCRTFRKRPENFWGGHWGGQAKFWGAVAPPGTPLTPPLHSGLWSRKSRHPTPTPTPGNFDYPTPTPTPTPDRLRPSAVLVT